MEKLTRSINFKERLGGFGAMEIGDRISGEWGGSPNVAVWLRASQSCHSPAASHGGIRERSVASTGRVDRPAYVSGYRSTECPLADRTGVRSRLSAIANRICLAMNSLPVSGQCNSTAYWSESVPAVSPSSNTRKSISKLSSTIAGKDRLICVVTKPDPINPPPAPTWSIRASSTSPGG